jgi:3-oxoacyl-[acyl-carrier protein] reductase
MTTSASRDLEGKKIFVTGGSRGIGASIVRHLASQGANVAFSYSSNEASAKALIAQLPQPEKHLMLRLDISDVNSVEEAFALIQSQFGDLDGVVNNAGITKDQLLLRMKPDDFDCVINTNLRGTFLVTKAAIKGMLKARKGSIVNITSVIGQTGNAGQANYAASKAGTEGFTKSVAKEVASRGIRVNCIAPGFINTEMTHVLTEDQKKGILSQIPLGRIAEPEEIAFAVSFLLGDQSKYITGHTLSVNGGMFM